jgi:nitrogenase-associated protein
MSVVVFYEKPGCAGNARQKALLEASGHTVIARNLLTTQWTRMQILAFLTLLPIPMWFNRNAPMIKRGDINPDSFDEGDAATVLSMLQTNPILIRRPLLEVDGVCRAGFEIPVIHAWIGLSAAVAQGAKNQNLETCFHQADPAGRCSGHDGVCSHEPSAALEG